MAKSFLLHPDDAFQRLNLRYRSQRRHWLAGGGEWPIRLPLGVPAEREAAEHLAQVRDWQAHWANWRGPARVEWVERRWPVLGTQRLPEALIVDSAEAVAALRGSLEEWSRARGRMQRIGGLWPALSATLPAWPDVLMEWGDDEFERLVGVVRWLASNRCSGAYIRQLPIPGVDGKWLESRQKLICDWLRRILGGAADGDLYDLAGLRRLPVQLRLRLLDPALRARMGGIGDIQAPVSELAALRLPVDRVFIVENLQTGLVFDDIPGAVVFMKQGYAVDLFGELQWLKSVPCYYWGDLDTHGFAILDRLRQHLPETCSILMDSETLVRHRALWVHEDNPVQADLQRLRADEQALFDGLRQNRWGVGVRLEQERVDWDYASAKILCSR